MDAPKFVIVMGTSAGGINALSEFVSQLKADIDAAIFFVMHLPGKSISDFLLHRLQPYTSLRCEMASEGSRMQKGVINIARADCL